MISKVYDLKKYMWLLTTQKTTLEDFFKYSESSEKFEKKLKCEIIAGAVILQVLNNEIL